MSIDAVIVDPRSGKAVLADEDAQAMRVSLVPYPPIVPQLTLPFRQSLTDDGTDDGSSSMVVDGSATPREFWVSAHPDRDRYIKSVSFLISDGGATLDAFGNIGVLANGCDIFYESPVFGEVKIAQAITTNFEFVRLCGASPAFGTAADVFRAPNVVAGFLGGSEAYIPILMLDDFSPDDGIKLDAGTNQRLGIRINDDVSGVDAFDAIAKGFDRFRLEDIQ